MRNEFEQKNFPATQGMKRFVPERVGEKKENLICAIYVCIAMARNNKFSIGFSFPSLLASLPALQT